MHDISQPSVKHFIYLHWELDKINRIDALVQNPKYSGPIFISVKEKLTYLKSFFQIDLQIYLFFKVLHKISNDGKSY